jgi:hypothetical protein
MEYKGVQMDEELAMVTAVESDVQSHADLAATSIFFKWMSEENHKYYGMTFITTWLIISRQTDCPRNQR